ncbi:uncharacterized protein EDB93DRAFT_1180920 [Suillus bovinus]|uniref:uncharacterized protein n=1 Tax=Suillus bovinus TaxID=48563 RepID=UPI001B87E42E|nr:uncharacterized protein EDB93DRAFT_1180920 [Suillus bovinus]KAG2130207.1 hypothetical protein EDB93DRAFT_1180920 [Suillus bovinus]
MVFSLFTRKPDSSSNIQLHTPSPSISHTDSPVAPSPTSPPTTATEPEPEPEVTDSSVLYDLVRSVPPQTLHTYTLAHLCPTSDPPLIPPSPRTLTALTHFFHELSPPPQLHCVRCHSSFFELSNTDTSCRISHDDESALVDRSAYETLWGCCGRSVEGTGDMGPPDGWCYEGRHTTDTKRARFRADSTIHDDKLVSCSATGCHGRKRKRSVSVSSSDLSASIRKKDKAKVNAKSNVDASPRSASKPTSKASTPRPTPKPLSKSGTFISSVTLVQARSIPLPKSNLHKSHVASPVVDAVSESEPDPQPDIPLRPARERTRTRSTVDEQKTRSTADDKTRPLADDNMCKPRTRSAAREERSLSRTRTVVRGGSVRMLREREREREKEKGIGESDGDDRGRTRGREVKKRRVGV